MRVLFCNIAWMDYYKGIIPNVDTPMNGGSFVKEYKDAHEKYNFLPVDLISIDGEEGTYCLGFVETKTTSKSKGFNDLHIEKLDGCTLLKKEPSIEDVLVIYCAARPQQNFTSVVGWYKHATVFRKYEYIEFSTEDGSVDGQYYNAIAKAEDCVLLPTADRRITQWKVPRRQSGISYGFGQANVWFPDWNSDNQNLNVFLKNTIRKIEEYEGDNWVNCFPDIK